MPSDKKDKNETSSTSTPYLGIPSYKPEEFWSVFAQEKVTIETWDPSRHNASIVALARIENITIRRSFPQGLEDQSFIMNVSVVTNTRHHFLLTSEDLKEEFRNYEALVKHLRTNSIFTAAKKEQIVEWTSRTLLRERTKLDDKDKKRKEAYKKAITTWKKMDTDLPGYIRNMDEEGLLRLVDLLDDFRIDLEQCIK